MSLFLECEAGELLRNVGDYHTTTLLIAEDLNLHLYRCENLRCFTAERWVVYVIHKASEIPDAGSTWVNFGRWRVLFVGRWDFASYSTGIFLWLVDFCKIYPLLAIPTQRLKCNDV